MKRSITDFQFPWELDGVRTWKFDRKIAPRRIRAFNSLWEFDGVRTEIADADK